MHLRPRTNTIAAVARIRSALSGATHVFFQRRDFLYVHTPLITTSDCEGAGEMFQVAALCVMYPSPLSSHFLTVMHAGVVGARQCPDRHLQTVCTRSKQQGSLAQPCIEMELWCVTRLQLGSLWSNRQMSNTALPSCWAYCKRAYSCPANLTPSIWVRLPQICDVAHTATALPECLDAPAKPCLQQTGISCTLRLAALCSLYCSSEHLLRYYTAFHDWAVLCR